MRAFGTGRRCLRALAKRMAGEGEGDRTRHRVGDPITVEIDGAWHPARVVTVLPDGRLEVHYEGWSPEWNQLVGRDRVAAPRAPSRTASGDRHAVGDAVVVRFEGVWYPAKVIGEVSDGRWEIRYDGWGAEWNQLVGTDRIAVPPAETSG